MFFNFVFNCRIMCASQQHRIIIFKRFQNSLQIISQLFSAQNAFFYLNRKWLCDALPDRESVLSKEFPENSATNFTVFSNQGFLGDVVFQNTGNTKRYNSPNFIRVTINRTCGIAGNHNFLCTMSMHQAGDFLQSPIQFFSPPNHRVHDLCLQNIESDVWKPPIL